jgi:hypothetical protein
VSVRGNVNGKGILSVTTPKELKAYQSYTDHLPCKCEKSSNKALCWFTYANLTLIQILSFLYYNYDTD